MDNPSPRSRAGEENEQVSVDETRAAREALRTSHRHAFMRLAQILFEEDPVGINFEDNTAEYEAEAGTILRKLSQCKRSI